MAQLIVLDARVEIAALSADDVHHSAAARALASAADVELVLAATSRAEILVGPFRAGGPALIAARDFVNGCETVPVTTGPADDAAALRARHPALSIPDAATLVVAALIDADAVWTFDRRWGGVDPRAVHPGDRSPGCKAGR